MKARKVLVIMSDEHDPRHMGCSGSLVVKTPHLDALAARGQRFLNAYTPSPICVPARAAFATGRRVHETRHWDNAMPYCGEEQGWGHVLQQEGIRVESIGKLHYRAEEDPAGFDKEHLPMYVMGGHGMVWTSIRDPYILRNEGKRMLGDKIGPGESPYTQYDASVTDRTIDWLKDAQTRPDESFVLYVGMVAPHFPLIAPQAFYDLYDKQDLPQPKLHPDTGYRRHPWVEDYARLERSDVSFSGPQERHAAFAAYYGLCSWMDHNVGRILNTLQDCGMADDTLVIYTSDHGDNVGARGLWGKSTLYQEAVCVPMIMAGPGVAPGVCETPVDLLDLFPSILQAAGIEPAGLMDGRPGRSLQDTAQSAAEPERLILSEYHAAGSNTAGFMLRKGRWKYHYYVRFSPELFDLQTDPEELHDLASDPQHASVLVEMEKALRQICDPEALDAQAKADQRAMVERLGGPEMAALMGPTTHTPAPTIAKF